jgi:endogenous inhibitor of DNA gyrase (YacG/DUF329 family)
MSEECSMVDTHQLRTRGLAIFATGGCLMWTVVLIPLALPMAMVGLGMFIWSFFTKREIVRCPVCGEAAQIDQGLNVFLCPHCQKPLKRLTGEAGVSTWIAV